MADVLPMNVTQLEQEKKESNDEEIEEVTVEKHKVITLHVVQEEKKNMVATESMCNVMKVVKSIIEVWNKEKEEVYVVDRNDQRICMDADWTNGVRIIGREGKRKVEMFVKIKTLKPLYELKEKF